LFGLLGVLGLLTVLAPAAGVVVAVCCAPGALVRPGQTLVGLRLDA